MIPDRDYYADKTGNLTDDPERYARQIAVKGCLLDDRVARRYGITDTLVSTGEPHAVRRVTGRSAASVQITKAADAEAQPEAKAEDKTPEAEPEAEEPQTAATKPVAKKDKDKGEKK